MADYLLVKTQSSDEMKSFILELELWVNFDHEWGLRGTFKTFTLSVTVNVMLVQFLSVTLYELLVFVFRP